jgi:O-antigen/teichoic acid export membrane protein
MGAISATTLLLTQIDKIVLSRLLSLEMFGYYSLAAVAANSLYALVAPVAAAAFPGLTREAASGNSAGTAVLYHRATQTVTVLVVPIAAVLAFFAPLVLRVWTGNAKVATVSGAVLSVLVTGVALNALMNIPYMLQLAYGRTNLTLYCNVAGLLLMVPALIVLTPRFGPIAAAIAWLVLNIGYITIEMTILHRRLLPGELRAWYMTDVGKPALAAVVTVLVAWMLSPDAEFGRAGAVAMLAGVVALATIAATLVTPLPRAWLSRHSRSLRAVSL